MSTFNNNFFFQCPCTPTALNTIFPSEKNSNSYNNNTLFPFESSFEDLLNKTKMKKGKKVYKVLEALRKSKSLIPLSPSTPSHMSSSSFNKKKRTLPFIKLFQSPYTKKESSPCIINKKPKRISSLINFHRKILHFNQQRISQENNKQISQFKNNCINNYENDEEHYTSLCSINGSPITTKVNNSKDNGYCNENGNKTNYNYSVLKSNKWDDSIQEFLQTKFEKTKRMFYMNHKDKLKAIVKMNNTTDVIKDDINADSNRIDYRNIQEYMTQRNKNELNRFRHNNKDRSVNRVKFIDKKKTLSPVMSKYNYQ